jgi:hypothetical protein
MSRVTEQIAKRLDDNIIENFADIYLIEEELVAIEGAFDLDDPAVIAGIATCADIASAQQRLIARPPAALATGLEAALERGKLRPTARLLASALYDGARRERDVTPSKVKGIPAFARPSRLPPLVTARGTEATADEVLAVVRAIAVADPGVPPDAAYTDESLAQLARALALGWLSHGAEPKHAWGAHAAGLFSDDATAGDLAMLARELAPRVGQFGKAQILVDVLAAMNTRTSLGLLLEIATKVRTRSIKERARAAFDAAAKDAGITEHDLADKLIPHDLPLGQPIPDFVKRLERRMVTGTPMTLLEFAENILQREAMRAKARGIVFGVVVDARLRTFAIGRDGVVDSDGEPFAPETTAQIVVVHPIDLEPAMIAKWRAVVTTQPFPQLARRVQRHTTLRAMTKQALVAAQDYGYLLSSRLLALEALGWQRGAVIGGQFSRLVRELDGITVAVDFQPAIQLAGGRANTSRITGISGKGKGPARAISEIAREIATLGNG